MQGDKDKKASLHEILAFAKSRGVELDDDAISILAKRLDEEPVSKSTLRRSKALVKNPLLKQVLDLTFVKRVERLKRISDNNPFIKLINERRRGSNGKSATAKQIPLPADLRKIFHDESKWLPFYLFFGIPQNGQIVKVIETDYPDKPYIGYLYESGSEILLRTTRRVVNAESLSDVKFYRIKEGLFDHEIKEVKTTEKRFLEYIELF